MPPQSALHIRTAEPGLADLVDAWLTTHRVRCTCCADVYEACVHLIKHSQDVPDIAFVGSDWLAADDFLILRYLRETWPSVAIVVYGTRDGATTCADEPLCRVCRSRRALLCLLEHPPALLLRRLRSAPGEPRSTDAAAVQPGGTREAMRGEKGDRPPAEPQPSEAPQGGQAGSESERAPLEGAPRTILTDEELSALLNGDEG